MSSIGESPLDIKRPAGQMPAACPNQGSWQESMDYILPQKELPVETALPSVSFTEQWVMSVGYVIEAELQPGFFTDFKPKKKTAARLIRP